MQVLIESHQNTHKGGGWADWSEGPSWHLSTARSAYSGHVRVKSGPWSNESRQPGLMNHIFFNIILMAGCVCIIYRGKRWHYLCGCYFNMYLNTPLNSTSLHGNNILQVVASFSRIMGPVTLLKWFQKRFDKPNNEFKVLTENSPDLNPIGICGTCVDWIYFSNNSNPWWPHLTTY